MVNKHTFLVFGRQDGLTHSKDETDDFIPKFKYVSTVSNIGGMPKKVKYSSNQPSMPGSVVKRQLVLSSQRAKVFPSSRRSSNLSNRSGYADNVGFLNSYDLILIIHDLT